MEILKSCVECESTPIFDNLNQTLTEHLAVISYTTEFYIDFGAKVTNGIITSESSGALDAAELANMDQRLARFTHHARIIAPTLLAVGLEIGQIAEATNELSCAGRAEGTCPRINAAFVALRPIATQLMIMGQPPA